MEEKTKAYSIIFIAFIFYVIFGAFNYLDSGSINKGSDFDFHWKKILGETEKPYSPLYHIIFSPLKINQFLFYLTNLFFILILIPYFIFQISKTFWSVLTYFTAIPLPHMIIFGATYPEAIVLSMVLFYWVNRKNWSLFFPLWIISSFMHSKGFYIFLIMLILEIIEINFPKIKPTINFPIVYIQEVVLNQKTLFSTILFQLPIGFLLICLNKIRDFFYLGLIMASILGAFFDIRALAIAQLIISINLGNYLKESNWKIKFPIIVSMAFYLIFFILNFVWGTWLLNH